MLPLAFDWTQFGQFAVDGLTLGSVYALIALGYTMVYGILKLLNFAHGDVYMVGAFIGYYTLSAFGGSLHATAPIALIVICMFLAAMLGCGLLGVGIERFAYRPLRNAPRIAPLISALGVSFVLENAAVILFGGRPKDYAVFYLGGDPIKLIPGPLFDSYTIGGVRISLVRIIVVATAAALMVALALFVKRSRLGKAMRATAFDREAASMMGIEVDRVIMVTFFIGSALAGAAGVMTGLYIGSNVNTYMGFIAGLKAFTAAVVGGIGSIPGAMVGGLLIGLAESFAQGYAPQGTTFVDLYVFAFLIVVLIVRPSGLLGTRELKKV